MTRNTKSGSDLHIQQRFDVQNLVQAKINGYLLDIDKLKREFNTALPFPHIILDFFLPEGIADLAFSTYPSLSVPIWTELPTDDQRKKWVVVNEQKIPPLQRSILQELNSGFFLHFLEQLTGIQGLIADTSYLGGGLHQIQREGRLSIHIDFSHHPQNGLFRRLNLLWYLNKDWKEEYGGHLELWDVKVTRCQKAILPIHNRLVIFETSKHSYHGHPKNLGCPATTTRKSMSLYYFTKEPPSGSETLQHNTFFRSIPGDRIDWKTRLLRLATSATVRDLLPPILYRRLRSFWNEKYAGHPAGDRS